MYSVCCSSYPINDHMIFTINANVFNFDFERVRPRGGWMGSHFHNWTDYNKVTFLACFSRVTRMGSQIFGIFGIRKFW